jgi:hypothetical protein
MSCTRCVGEHVQLVDIVVRSKALGDLVGGIGSQWELVKEALDRSGDCKERTVIGLLWRAIGAFGWHCGEAFQSRKVAEVPKCPSAVIETIPTRQARTGRYCLT